MKRGRRHDQRIIDANPDRPRSGDEWRNYWEQAEQAIPLLDNLSDTFGDMINQWYFDHPGEDS
jgi:hypothetical protein